MAYGKNGASPIAGKQNHNHILSGFSSGRSSVAATAFYSIAFTSIMILVVLSTLPLQASWAGAFPGINGQIAFEGGGDIRIMNPDGSRQIFLTGDFTPRMPSWSPDGTKIAFVTSQGITIMNADGSNEKVIGEGGDPSWSPDGAKIAFTSSRDGNSEIYTMNAADGSGQTRLTKNDVSDHSPSWSPDGTRIAFTRVEVEGRADSFEIYVMNAADGSNEKNLTNNTDAVDEIPSWSPDGKKIAFESLRTLPDGTLNVDIYTMNAADGSGQTRLTTNPNVDYRPSWSPDGTKIAFVSTRDGNDEIYVMNAADGSGQTRLTANLGADREPDWGVHPPLPPAEISNLVVDSVDLSSNPLPGMWAVVRSAADGAILATGFTPLTFAGDTGTDYRISVGEFDGKMFDRWEDGNPNRARVISLLSDVTITALYDIGDTLRGFTSLTYTGAAEQPDLTVDALSLDGGRALRMWTIIDPQSSDATETTYKVYAGNYQNIVFDHWDDGSTDRVRTLTIGEATTLTAYYRTTG